MYASLTGILIFFILQSRENKELEVREYGKLIKTIKDIEGSFLYALHSTDFNEKEFIPFDRLNKQNVVVKKSKWGAFYQLSSIGLLKIGSIKKSFFYGNPIPSSPNIYLENNNGLKVVGNTALEGYTNINTSKITKPFIEGKSFKGEIKLNTTANSKKPTPISTDLKSNILDYLKGSNYPLLDSIITTYDFPEELHNSFFNKTWYISSRDEMNLKTSFDGNIILYSSKKITIDSSSNIQNVILYAPVISIHNGVKGSFQAFASDSILIGANCVLEYPSVLGLFSTKKTFLHIDSNSRIEGLVINDSKNKESKTIFQKEVKMLGYLMDQNKLMFQGEIYGNVYANYLIYESNSTNYTNILIDAQIKQNKDFKYLIYGIFEKELEFKPMKEVY